MLAILICLAQTFLPSATELIAEIEVQAVVVALSVFVFLVYRLYAHTHSTARHA